MDDLRAACAQVACAGPLGAGPDRAIAAYAALAAPRRRRRRRRPRLTAPSASARAADTLDARRDQLRLGLVSHAAQGPGRSGYETVAGALASTAGGDGPGARRALTIDARHDRRDPRPGPRARADGAVRRLAARPRPPGHRRSRRTFAAFVDDAGGSAVPSPAGSEAGPALPTVASTTELELPFLKRAQLAAADLQRAGVARFADLAR